MTVLSVAHLIEVFARESRSWLSRRACSSFSAGITLISHRLPFAEGMAAADAALYRAKASGRNCVVTADERLRAAS